MVLVQFAHPRLEESRINKALAASIRGLSGVTWNDLYQRYPDFDVDIEAEQALLLAHQTVVFLHPFYWYSSPPLVKQWIDLVLEHGWAYGSRGNQLAGKRWLQIITTGGPEGSYQALGPHGYTIAQFLSPFEQTAKLCAMQWLTPLAVHSAHRMSDRRLAEEIDRVVARLKELI